MTDMSRCSTWYEGDSILEEYHNHECCKINHDDRDDRTEEI